MYSNIVDEHFGVKKDCLQHFTGLDKYMRQLEGKTFSRVSVVTGRQVYYFPTFFMIFFAQWDFYTSTGGCQPPRTWTITEPAPRNDAQFSDVLPQSLSQT